MKRGAPPSIECPSPDMIRAVAAKYRRLVALRRAHAESGAVLDRHEARALARAFPGALRELDSLALDEIEHRAESLERASDELEKRGSAPESPAWIVWICAYHALTRAAQRVKRDLAARPPSSDRSLAGARLAELVRAGSEAAGVPIDAAFIESIAAPPDGRLSNAVFEEMGRRLSADPRTMRARLFPSRRGTEK